MKRLPILIVLSTLAACGGDRSAYDAASASGEPSAVAGTQTIGSIERLDPAKRTILVLRAVEQLSYEEISEHLSIPMGTVMSRLNRARAALLDELARDSSQEEQPTVFPFRAYKQA